MHTWHCAQLDSVADSPLVLRSTLEMKSIYKSIRLADARYADSVVGSPDYMAIETLRGQSYSYSVDYWSLGCILFECVSRPAAVPSALSGDPCPPSSAGHTDFALSSPRNRFLAGFPPFSGATADETWLNLKNWTRVLRRPHYDRPEDRIFNLSDEGWSAITWCVAPRYLSFRIAPRIKEHRADSRPVA